MRRLFYGFVVLAVVCFVASSAVAETIAITGWTDPATDTADGTVGFKFTVQGTQDLKVTQLGFYDDDLDGLNESHEVGIWTEGGSSLLGSATVVSGDTLDGFYRYHDLGTSDFTLTAGNSYRIGARVYNDASSDEYLKRVATLTTASEVQWNHGAYVLSSFAYPGIYQNPEHVKYFAPNFKFEIVPEPGSFVLLSVFALVALVGYIRRRR